jgi:hypothetical protein
VFAKKPESLRQIDQRPSETLARESKSLDTQSRMPHNQADEHPTQLFASAPPIATCLLAKIPELRWG